MKATTSNEIGAGRPVTAFATSDPATGPPRVIFFDRDAAGADDYRPEFRQDIEAMVARIERAIVEVANRLRDGLARRQAVRELRRLGRSRLADIGHRAARDRASGRRHDRGASERDRASGRRHDRRASEKRRNSTAEFGDRSPDDASPRSLANRIPGRTIRCERGIRSVDTLRRRVGFGGPKPRATPAHAGAARRR